jgi:hypothetical protein
MHKNGKRLTLEDVDILTAVDTDQPFGNTLFVPVSVSACQPLHAGCVLMCAYFTVSDILEESENSDSVGLP